MASALPEGCVVGHAAPFSIDPRINHRVTPSLESVIMASANRNWAGHPAECCGRCDQLGWKSCLLAWFLPFVAIGMNKRRAFAASMALWTTIFFILFLVHYYNFYIHFFIPCSQSTLCTLRAVIFVWGGLITGIVISILGACNRCSLRKQYNLPGDDCQDCMLWCCCIPCALCQETRTLAYNNVENGEWEGPNLGRGMAIGLPLQAL
ncbi:hypothetical protein BSKO_07529 [Bryopsis sp. KO-2023]|nr:hypothetical protein BSKO_07529 [Bryopsis sp. KO-2023]